jgi:hypothetical protein
MPVDPAELHLGSTQVHRHRLKTASCQWNLYMMSGACVYITICLACAVQCCWTAQCMRCLDMSASRDNSCSAPLTRVCHACAASHSYGMSGVLALASYCSVKQYLSHTLLSGCCTSPDGRLGDVLVVILHQIWAVEGAVAAAFMTACVGACTCAVLPAHAHAVVVTTEDVGATGGVAHWVVHALEALRLGCH